MATMLPDIETQSDQLDRRKRAVSYDMYDIIVRQLVDMASSREIDIAPDYQRHFVWDNERESELIESIFLGIPVPSLYMATNRDGSWEVVDGVQRLSTLIHFCGDDAAIGRVRKKSRLKLTGLTKLTSFNGCRFDDLPRSVQLNFTLRPVRVTTLNDKSDYAVRYDLFERLNTGGIELHPQEIRNCVYQGPFRDMIKELSRSEDYRRVVIIPQNERQEAIYEELVLRFFAFLENYQAFEHSVVDFLTEYMAANIESGPQAESAALFHGTMVQLGAALPNGIARGNRRNTPLNLYEGVAVGAALAMQTGAPVHMERLPAMLDSPDLRAVTTGATNSRIMVQRRIEMVRDELLR